jgi:hypothetical protein
VNVAQLLADLARLGIRLEARGDRLGYWPRSALSPDLTERLKAHKDELLAKLRGEAGGRGAKSRPQPPPLDLSDANAVWQAALESLEGDPQFPPESMQALRAARARWSNEPQPPTTEPIQSDGPTDLGADPLDDPFAEGSDMSALTRCADLAADDGTTALTQSNRPRCKRCGGTRIRDVSIHDGRSTRRDCAQCGRFFEFTRWYETGFTESTETRCEAVQ